jgi:hypothetical protein
MKLTPLGATRIGYGAGGDHVIVSDGVLGRIDRLEFSDGSALDWAQVMANHPALNISGTEAGERLVGGNQNDVIDGAGGDGLPSAAIQKISNDNNWRQAA